MINLLLAIPYPEMRETVDSILAAPPYNRNLHVDTILMPEKEFPDFPKRKYDAIIARGFSNGRIHERYPDIPIIPLTVSEFDIFQTILESHIKAKAKRIAVIAFFGDFSESSQIFDFLGCTVTGIPVEDEKELPSIMRQLEKDGYDAVIGGYSAYLIKDSCSIPVYLVHTSRNTIIRALNEARSTVDQLRNEHFLSEIYKSMLYASGDGILFVRPDGTIQVRNHVTHTLCGSHVHRAVSLKLKFPSLWPYFEEVLQTEKELSGVLSFFPETGITVSSSFTPVLVDDELSGILITMTDVTQIQHLESKIRASLSRKGMTARYTFRDVVHESGIIEKTIASARKFALSDSNVFIVGESGTGKEVFAQSIHNESSRKNGPFVAVNCAALPDNLLESELFGYVDGAFTGASKGGKMGMFEQAHNGTLFLDEIAEIAPSTQAVLLRVLQEKQVRRIGDDKMIPVNVRVISATNRPLSTLVASGAFRQDLLYRLDVLRLFIPPLRARENDISLLFRWMIEQYAEKHGLSVPAVSPEAFRLLQQHPFYGNIRELQNVAERACLNIRDNELSMQAMLEALNPPDLSSDIPGIVPPSARQAASASRSGAARFLPSGTAGFLPSDESAELLRTLSVLEKHHGNKTSAAKELGIDRTTLWRRLKKLSQQKL